MTQRMPAVTARQLARVLQKKGWQLHRTKGSHQHYFHPDRTALITVPVHTGSLKHGLLAGILKDAGISREEFQELL